MDQEGKDSQQQQSGGLWVAGIFFVALVFLLMVLGGYVQEWKWTGLAVDTNYPKRTLWDWLDLLIVPAVLAIGGYLFTRSESRRTQQTAEKERTLDREIADERRQDDMLQAYLDGMSQLLTDKELPLHRAQPDDSLGTVARARTLTVLGRLDSVRKRSVLQFLHESGLIYKEHTLLNGSYLVERRHNIVSLQQANLREADLSRTSLNYAALREAALREADLSSASLFRADLSFALLLTADLSGASLREADLRDADLRYIHLSGAREWTEEQLSEARSLRGATMPNGQKYEDWLKSKGDAEDGKSGSSS